MTTVAQVIAVSTTVALLSAPAFAQVQRSDDLSELRTFTIAETRELMSPLLSRGGSTNVRSTGRTQKPRSLRSSKRGASGVMTPILICTSRLIEPSRRTDVWRYGWSGWGDDDWGHYGFGSDYLDSTVASTLFIDVTSADTGELLWRGIGMRHMHITASPKDRLERINREVRQVFKDYPFG
jgi:hypothetical protein